MVNINDLFDFSGSGFYYFGKDAEELMSSVGLDKETLGYTLDKNLNPIEIIGKVSLEEGLSRDSLVPLLKLKTSQGQLIHWWTNDKQRINFVSKSLKNKKLEKLKLEQINLNKQIKELENENLSVVDIS